MYSTSCHKKRLIFENTLYIYQNGPKICKHFEHIFFNFFNSSKTIPHQLKSPWINVAKYSKRRFHKQCVENEQFQYFGNYYLSLLQNVI
jgi:hypothetical protein